MTDPNSKYDVLLAAYAAWPDGGDPEHVALKADGFRWLTNLRLSPDPGPHRLFGVRETYGVENVELTKWAYDTYGQPLPPEFHSIYVRGELR